MASDFCLIFDCDGTLVDSEPLLASALEHSLTKAGLPFEARRYMEEFRGVQFARILAAMEQEHGMQLSDEHRESTENTMRIRLEDHMRASLEPIEGVETTLATLDQPCCVASNGPLRKIRLSMETSGLGRFFGDRLFSAYEIGTWKPDPGLYRHAGEVMGFNPERCVVIDDAPVGVEAGMAAGMHVVHLNRFSDRESTPEGAWPIERFDQLPEVIARLQRRLDSTVQ
ncbi:HAD-IA family hydrolase [Kushneria phosphatilytica]|uniref:HAD-IA family hydrolase n=1 Tax=Kushneria phosphatilytica TaxID=657387 RepID=A0A1S1NVH1_9GAMM|nr:HAD-IA family hydrolase [Kushneria phosphatilytica]OHV10536.1 haloacid dehalogenase [Kushneria phosphatilytica]QEL11897.1 HAD-IA family hydrolase [Kushneria phosphatilytica]